MRRTVDYLVNLRDLDQPYISIAAPYPGTAIREQALRGEGGARLLHDDYGSLLRYGSSAMEVNDLTAADLVAFQSTGLRRAYRKPRRMLYNFFRAGLLAGIRNGIAFLRATIGRPRLRRGRRQLPSGRNPLDGPGMAPPSGIP